MTTTDHAMHELPTLPTNLLMLIGEYGMARSDKCTPIEVTHRWLLLIDGIKAYATDYARAAIQQAAGAVPEGCRIVPIEPTESMLVFVHRLAWINAVNASPSPLGREAGSSDHLVPCAGGWDGATLPTPPAQRWQVGAWTLTAPDGRTWQADSPLKACSAEQRDRIPPEVVLQRIFDALNEGKPA